MPIVTCTLNSGRGKRKRGVGEYVDQETGEKRVIETTRHAKIEHRIHGTWYKKPTEAELRRWDREEELANRAERLKQREESKKINSAKRAAKAAKERDIVQRQYEQGRITYTQTLGKKDASQPNLHSWFGGRQRKEPMSVRQEQNIENDGNSHSSEAESEFDNDAVVAYEDDALNSNGDLMCRTQENRSFELGDVDWSSPDIDEEESKAIGTCSTKDPPVQDNNLTTSLVEQHRNDSESAKDKIAQAGPAEISVPAPTFKIPSLPARSFASSVATHPPRADLQFQTFRSHSLDDETGSSDDDLFAGLCTQDLLNVNVPDIKSATSYPTISMKGLQQLDQQAPQSNSLEDYEDLGLDDETLLSLPATQLVLGDHNEQTSNVLNPLASQHFKADEDCANDEFGDISSLSDVDLLDLEQPIQDMKPPKSPLKRKSSRALSRVQCDSFAMSDFSDDDLMQGLQQYEKAQETNLHNNESSLSAMTTSTKKKRILPWNIVQDESSQERRLSCQEQGMGLGREGSWSATPPLSQCSV